MQSVTWFVTITSFWEVAAGWLPNYICTLCKLTPPHWCSTLNISNSYIGNITNLYVSWTLNCSRLEKLHMHMLEFYYFSPSTFCVCVLVCLCVQCRYSCCMLDFLLLKNSQWKIFSSLLLISIILFLIDWLIVCCLSHPPKIDTS